jgi:hypothetical protein
MHKTKRALAGQPGQLRPSPPESSTGQELIALAQKLARDAEHHALLSASLASQADRLMLAGLQRLQARQQPTPKSC